MSDADQLKEKLKDWKLRLSGDDRHSIRIQIAEMLSRSAFYRGINESRKFLTKDNEGETKANGPLHRLIDEGYVTMHVAGVRRLVDTSPISGPRGVFSLFGLIRDIKDNLALLTRANTLAARGLEYDFGPIQDRAFETARIEAKAKGERAYGVSTTGWIEAEWWHEAMDRLSGVTPDNRSREDAPRIDKLEQLEWQLIEHGRSLKDYCDKYVAHAASPESRNSLKADHQSVSLAKLWLAERALVRVVGFVSLYIVNGSNFGGVPIPQFEHLAYLEEPFIQPAAMNAVKTEWDQHAKEIRSCDGWFWDQPLSTASDRWEDIAP
jgi:hypothetical protein